MTELGDRVRRLIAAAGPIPVSDFMALALFDPEHGYYTTRDPFGRDGDFITAPEISQMFGELVGIWIVDVWNAIGRPPAPIIAEIGPGRGTLFADIIRTLGKLAPDLSAQARLVLVETSPRLAGIQRGTLGADAARIGWHVSIDELPEAPMIIVGNELFDAIPMRQFVKTPMGWCERVVACDEAGALHFAAGTASLAADLLPPDAASAPMGSIFEVAPARESLMQGVAARIVRDGGAGLFIDYGHTQPGIGDTFQALRHHEPADPLMEPGRADLTSHVDFAALMAAARSAGAGVALMTQGEFLVAMGLLERAGRLGADRGRELQERLSGEVERLAGPDQMGDLFKAMLVTRKGTDIRPFGRAD